MSIVYAQKKRCYFWDIGLNYIGMQLDISLVFKLTVVSGYDRKSNLNSYCCQRSIFRPDDIFFSWDDKDQDLNIIKLKYQSSPTWNKATQQLWGAQQYSEGFVLPRRSRVTNTTWLSRQISFGSGSKGITRVHDVAVGGELSQLDPHRLTCENLGGGGWSGCWAPMSSLWQLYSRKLLCSRLLHLGAK